MFRSWWQKIKQHLITILIVAIILVVAIALIIVGYRFDWTGFNGSNKSGKTLWDWLQLLIIPAVLAGGGLWFSQVQKDREQRAADQRAKRELDIAEDNQREAALQAYIDNMSELLLKEHLSELTTEDKLKPEYEKIRTIAQARTFTVLPRLDQERKRNVLVFLHEANLIDKSECIVSLGGADLREAHLRGVCLIGSELSGVDFSGANLSGARLEEANLYGANLTNAVMSLPMEKTEGDADLLESVLAMRASYSIQNLSNAAFLAGYFIGRAEGINTNLRNANLCMSTLTAADLCGVDLCNAHLHRAFLVKAKLQKAILHEASLKEAILIEANLQEADLRGANLSDAILYGADLTGANLSGAVLTGAEVAKEQLDRAKSLQGAIMPDGSKHP